MSRLQEIYEAARQQDLAILTPEALSPQDTAQINALDAMLTELTNDRFQFSIEVNPDTLDMAVAISDDRHGHGVFVPFSIKKDGTDKSVIVVDGDRHKPVEFTFPSDNEVFARFLASEYAARIKRQNRALAIVEYLSHAGAGKPAIG